MPRVLLVGKDESLLRTRCAIVARTGAEVLCASPDEVLSNRQIDPVDVLVICHTLRQEERQEFTGGLRERWRGVWIIQLAKFEIETRLPASHADEVVVAAKPAQLIGRIRAALQKVGEEEEQIR